MLLDRIDEKTFQELAGKAGRSPEFDPSRYELLTQYDSVAGAMTYLAVRKDLFDDSLPLGYYFSLGADLEIRTGKKFPWFPLLAYLRRWEMGMSSQEQKDLYGEAYHTLGVVAGLTPAERAAREKARASFLSFVDHLGGKGLLSTQSPMEKSLSLEIEMLSLPKKDAFWLIRLKIGPTEGKRYLVQDSHAFCQALKLGGEYAMTRKMAMHLSVDAFAEEWQPFIEHLLEHVGAGLPGKVPVFEIPWDHIPAFFALMPIDSEKDFLSLDGEAWKIVREETPASVTLDPEGALIMTPALGKEDAFVTFEKRMAVFCPEQRQVLLTQFESPLEAELFSYFHDRTPKEIEYVADLFVQNILPATSGMIRKSRSTVFQIRVYISLQGEALQFDTQYWVGEKRKKLSDFEGKTLEQALIRSYAAQVQSLHGVVNGEVRDPGDVLFFLRSDLSGLRQLASIFLDERLKRLKIQNPPAVKILATKVSGWLNLSFHSEDYTPEELEEIYRAYRKKKSFFLLKDNLILLEPEGMEPVEELIRQARAEKSLSEVKLPFYHIMQLQGYQEAGVDISMDQWVEEAVSGVVDYRGEALEGLGDLPKILRPYQADAVRWLRRLSKYGFSGILADDMGLGKTLEVLAFVSGSDFSKPVLIVCAKSLVYNWRNEIRKWLGDAPTLIIDGPKAQRLERIAGIPSEGRVFAITGYDSLRSDIVAYEGKTFSLVVADEAQNIKNATTQKAKAIRKVESEMRLALTGTPVENSLLDLWSLFDFLMPGYLGTEAEFRRRFESAEDQAKARQVLSRKVSPFLLRRSKEEVLDSLPGKEVMTVTVSMEEGQRDLYEAYLHKARKLAKTYVWFRSIKRTYNHQHC